MPSGWSWREPRKGNQLNVTRPARLLAVAVLGSMSVGTEHLVRTGLVLPTGVLFESGFDRGLRRFEGDDAEAIREFAPPSAVSAS